MQLKVAREEIPLSMNRMQHIALIIVEEISAGIVVRHTMHTMDE